MADILGKDYWQERYQNQSIGWDIGYVSTPIKNYIDQLIDPDLKILIPGAGNAYEAEYLHQRGFQNVHVVDISSTPLNNLRKRCASFPSDHLHEKDFFDLQNKFDLILEQTFFCAILPKYRGRYASKMHELLNPNGKLVGVLFDAPLNDHQPPFGGTKEEYWFYFKPYFKIKYFERCNHSISPRAGTELFINLIKI